MSALSALTAGSARYTSRLENAALACAIAIGFSVPISAAFDNVLLGLVLLFWVASGQFGSRAIVLARNPVALAALALFALLAIGLCYGERASGDGLKILAKYSDLAFIPIFITLFRAPLARRYAWHAFSAAMTLTLVLSYLSWAGVIPGDLFGDRPHDPAVFKKYLSQNIMMALAVFVFVHQGRLTTMNSRRYAWYALAALAAINVLVLNPGRTGQAILIALSAYSAYNIWRWRGAVAAGAAALFLIAVSLQMLTPAGDRVMEGLTELHSWQPQQATETSIGMRMEFYRGSLEILRHHPIFGAGTGGFASAYREAAGSLAPLGVNPHNEYLNIAVQLGLIGLILLLCLFLVEWRWALRLITTGDCELARAVVITFVIGCIFNSLLMDHAEGLLFSWASGVMFAGLKTDNTPELIT